MLALPQETQKIFWKIFGDMDENRQIRRSRNTDGNVANANWNGDNFKANWNYANNRNPKAGGREEVSRIKES